MPNIKEWVIEMDSSIRVELPIANPSNVLSECKTMADLRGRYPTLHFAKYIYLDPADNKLKGANPPNDLPVVADAYITVIGNIDEIIRFATDATRKTR